MRCGGNRTFHCLPYFCTANIFTTRAGHFPDPSASSLPHLGALCPGGEPVGSLWVGQWEAPDGTWRVASTRGRVDGPGFLLPHCWRRAVPLGQRALIPRLVRWPLHTALLSRFWNGFLRQFPLLALGPRLVPGGKLS